MGWFGACMLLWLLCFRLHICFISKIAPAPITMPDNKCTFAFRALAMNTSLSIYWVCTFDVMGECDISMDCDTWAVGKADDDNIASQNQCH